MYVTDCSNGGGIMFNLFREDGHFIKRIHCNSPPFSICIAPDDHILATCTVKKDHNSFTVFSPTHWCIAKFDACGEGKGQFIDINSIAINSSGTIFVAEGSDLLDNMHGNNRLQIIKS